MKFLKVVVIGTSIFEYVHEDDRCELANYLGVKNFELKRFYDHQLSNGLDFSFDNINSNGLNIGL